MRKSPPRKFGLLLTAPGVRKPSRIEDRQHSVTWLQLKQTDLPESSDCSRVVARLAPGHARQVRTQPIRTSSTRSRSIRWRHIRPLQLAHRIQILARLQTGGVDRAREV